MACCVPPLGWHLCVQQIRKRLLSSSLTVLPSTCWLLRVISLRIVCIFCWGQKVSGQWMELQCELHGAPDRRIVYITNVIKLR
jgi:hypothetical protein